MDPLPHKRPDAAQDLALCYALALSIGYSLDVEETCRTFLTALQTHLNPLYGSIWLCDQEGPGPACETGYTLGYALPELPVAEERLAAGHPLALRLAAQRTFALSAREGKPLAPRQVAAGGWIWKLTGVGFLVLFIEDASHDRAGETLEGCAPVLDRFAAALQACLRVQGMAPGQASAELPASDLLIDHVHMGVLLEGADGSIRQANETFCGLFGLEGAPEQLAGAEATAQHAHWASLFAAPEAFLASTSQHRESTEEVLGEVLKLADGRVFARDFTPFSEQLRGCLWQYRDVTAQQKADQEVRWTKEFYEQVLDALPTQLAVFSPEGRYLYVSPSAVRSPEIRAWLIGKTDVEYFAYRGRPREDGQRRYDCLKQVAETGEIYTYEETLNTPTGEKVHFVRFMSPVFKDGQVTQVLGFGLDITDRKRAEQALLESEERYKQFVEHATDVIYQTDPRGRFTYANPTALRLLGYAQDAVEGRHYLELVRQDWQMEVRAFYFTQVREGRESTYFEFPAVSVQGETVWLGQNVQMIRRDDRVVGLQAVARDITERRQAEEALRDNEARKRAIFESALDCIISIDDDGCIIEFNPAAEATFGYRREDLLGQKMADFIVPPNLRSPHTRGMQRYKETGVASVLGQRIELTAMRADGSEFPVEMAITPIELKRGRIFSAYLRDITERKQTMAALEQAREQAETSMRAREQFLANMSHEMRTPLNAVVGMAYLLRGTAMDSDQQRYLEAIQFSADNLLALINDLLDLAKITADRIEFERVPFRLRSQLQRLVDTLQIRAHERDIFLRLQVDEALPEGLVGDPTRLSQILMNLIGNAIKFTHRGGVQVTVTQVEQEADQVLVCFEVSDTGVGIPENKLGEIFDTFTQARSDTTRRFGGTGLGLSIVRQLVERQGGHVMVESAEGEGSTFRVRLPFRRADAPADVVPAADDAASAPIVLTGLRVLVAEDNEINQFVAARIMEQWGMVVDLAWNGRQALDRVAVGDYALVLMDIQMPEMDGIEATRRIRQLPGRSAAELPILALTASVIGEQREQILASGMNDFILKPFDPADLQARIARAVGARAALGDPGVRLTDLEVLERNAAGSTEFIAGMIDIFLRQLPGYAETLEEVLETENWEQARFAAHKLKASVATFGLSEITAALRQIEGAEADQSEVDLRVLVELVLEQLDRVAQELATLRARYP